MTTYDYFDTIFQQERQNPPIYIAIKLEIIY